MTETEKQPGRRALVEDLRVRIDRRHMRTGEGFRGGIVLHEVPSIAGTRADAIALDFRRSAASGDALIGYEIKVDRGDWLDELSQPEKAAAWARHCTSWWVIAPPAVVRPEELPDGWGLLTPVAQVRATATVAAKVRRPAPLPLPVVLELAKKIDSERVKGIEEATRPLRAELYAARDAARTAAMPAEEDRRDAELFRALLGRLGVDHHELHRWAFHRGGSAEEQVLAAALDGAGQLVKMREAAERQVSRARQMLTEALNRLEEPA